jgi:hypothetical protein
MTTTRRISTRGALAALVVPILVVVGIALASESTAQASSPGSGCVGAYGWPVKPFDRPHPIRGNFGDPRTVFDGPRSQRTIELGDGMFQFHHGVDISAPDGAPVFAVADGTITRTQGDRVTVECPNGRAIQYWHLHVPNFVRVGSHAVAGKTLLGYILPKREHVHLTELAYGQPVNPVAHGHLTPYRDTTRPAVLGISFRRGDLGGALSPRALSGSVNLYAEAIDTPALPVPGRWNGFPVTPAVVKWRIETSGGRTVSGPHVARDVRRTIPGTSEFWLTFARGSHQNWPVFSDGKARGMTGRYVFELTTRPLDMQTLRPGRYVLVVTASDTAGNSASRKVEFSVDDA